MMIYSNSLSRSELEETDATLKLQYSQEMFLLSFCIKELASLILSKE